MIYKIIWNLFSKGLIKYYVKSQNIPYKYSDLEYRFTDSNGKRYYGMPEKMSISEDRWAKLQEFLIWLSNGLTAESLNMLLDKADKHLEDGVVKMAENKRPNAIKLAAIMNEIRTRQDMIRPNELLYNILAVQLIREDEDPMLFNNKIHMEKVIQFEDERELGNNFFFALPEFKILWRFQNFTEEQWTEYFKASKEIYQKYEKQLQYL